LGVDSVALNAHTSTSRVTRTDAEFKQSLHELSTIVTTLQADAGPPGRADQIAPRRVRDARQCNDLVHRIVLAKLVKRGVPVKNFKKGDSEPAAGSKVRRVVTIQQGIPIEAAREIVKFIKDQKLKKVQAAIQGDQLRVTSPSKDELQAAMQVLRGHDFGVSLHFGNYR
jgi:hypothetical protein